MAAIKASNLKKGVTVNLSTLGPLFSVEAKSMLTGESLGRAEGFIRPTFKGPLLHLDTIRLDGQGLRRDKGVRSVLGVGFMVGAVAVRHGIDCGCERAELLAIKDNEEFHEKLVKYYKRMGFRVMEEVTGERFRDMGHMLVWGGVGTKMEASLVEILNRWKALFRV